MNKTSLYLALAFIIFGCSKETAQTVSEEKETVKIVDFDGLEPYLNKKDDKTYVVNFWATWCTPCVAELPAFEKLHETYKEKDVEVLLVSLDFKKQLNTKLIPFIKKNNLQPTVILLNDGKENQWIPKVNQDWSGAIPATLIYNKNKREFYEQSFDYKTLKEKLIPFLN